MAENFWDADPVATDAAGTNFWDADPVVGTGSGIAATTPKQDRTWGEAGTDFAASIGQGVGDLVRSSAWLERPIDTHT